MTESRRPADGDGREIVVHALEEGARLSREACSQREVPALHLRLWRRYKWGVIGLALFLLYELVMLMAGSTMGTHF